MNDYHARYTCRFDASTVCVYSRVMGGGGGGGGVVITKYINIYIYVYLFLFIYFLTINIVAENSTA